MLGETNWDLILQGSANEMWIKFRDILSMALEKTVPLVRPKPRTRDWLTRQTKKALTRKRCAWNVYRCTSSEHDFLIYKSIRNQCTALVRRDRRNFQMKLASQATKNPKCLFRHLARLRKAKVDIRQLDSHSGPTTTDAEAAEALASYFSSTFREQLSMQADSTPTTSADSTLDTVLFDPAAILAKLQKLRPNISPGIDNIPSIVLRRCANTLSHPLSIIFQHSFMTASLPHEWKLHTITPIHKSGNRSNPCNYRPVALLPIVSKVMESIIDDAIRQFLQETRSITVSQHGFVRGRSCTTNLLAALNHWTLSRETRDKVDVIFLDIAKAFDQVPHHVLAGKLVQVGITGRLLKWLSNYLADRQFRVRVNGSFSHWHAVTSEVPRGSILGCSCF